MTPGFIGVCRVEVSNLVGKSVRHSCDIVSNRPCNIYRIVERKKFELAR